MGRGWGQSKLHKDGEENKVLPFITNWGGRHRIHRCRHRSAEETRREAEDLERGRPEPLQPCVASRRRESWDLFKRRGSSTQFRLDADSADGDMRAFRHAKSSASPTHLAARHHLVVVMISDGQLAQRGRCVEL